MHSGLQGEIPLPPHIKMIFTKYNLFFNKFHPLIHAYISLNLTIHDNTKYSSDNANILLVTAMKRADEVK